jgi:predicted CoA-binding protein
MLPAQHHVAVLGATPTSGRYANRAVVMLKNKGYRVTPVNPRFTEIEGLPVAHRLEDIVDPVDTLTLYVGPGRLEKMIDSIVALQPGRVIFNPGSESRSLQGALTAKGIEWEEACTLVLLQTGQF